jgi:hypothetical protein
MGYLRFKQRWKTFQEFYHTSTLESELVYMLRDRCMKKEMADKISHEETIEGCLETLGKHYYRPVKAAKELMAEVTAFKKMQGKDYGRLFEYYVTLQTVIGEAEREKDLSYLLLQPENLILMESVLPTRELELWRNMQGDEKSPDLGKVFKEFIAFIAERESWVRRQVTHSTAPPPGQGGRRPDVRTKRAADTGSSHRPAEKKLARKKTKGRSSGQADGATVRVKLKQGAYTTTLETVAAPSAVSEGPWGCCVAKCQQPRHQLRNCAAFQRIPVEDRGSLVRLHHLCRKCLEPDHGLRGSACSSTAVGPKEICPIKKCKGKHHLLLHLKPIEGLRMESCPVSPGRQECQEEVSGQQEVAAERLAAVASEQDVLKVPLGEQDVRPVLEVPPGEQDMQPVLEVPPGEQDMLSGLHETSPAERGESAALQQPQLDMERLQREKDEMQRTFQLEMERIQRIHQLEKDEMQRTSQLEKMEMQRISQLEKMVMQRTFQLEMGEMQRTFQLEKMEMQRVRQQEEEKKLEGSSGMSWKEEGIECGSSAVAGLTGPASCTATEGKAESLLLAAKGHPPMWRSEMSEVRSDDCEGRELRTEEASRQKLEQRMAGLVAMLAVVLVGSGGHSRGGLIRKKEAIRGRMDEQPQENVMALVGQWRPTAGRPPRWPPPDEDNASRGAMTQPRGMWRPEAWLAAVQGRELCQTSWHW